MKSYIRFEDVTPAGRKTKVEWVFSESSDSILGTISWFGRWRQYTFFPAMGTVFSVGCMEDINREIKRLATERNTVRQKCERCNRFALPNDNRCKYHMDTAQRVAVRAVGTGKRPMISATP